MKKNNPIVKTNLHEITISFCCPNEKCRNLFREDWHIETLIPQLKNGILDVDCPHCKSGFRLDFSYLADESSSA